MSRQPTRVIAVALLLSGCTDREVSGEPVTPTPLQGTWDLSSWPGAAALTADFPAGCVAGAGDINGDGHDDLVVGHGSERYDIEGAWVYYGMETPLPNLASIPDLGPRIQPDAGGRVCAQRLGDVDGDGSDDVLLHAHAVWVLRGGSGVADGAEVSDIADKLSEPVPRSYASGGDVDDDGMADIVLAADDETAVQFGTRSFFWTDPGREPPVAAVSLRSEGDLFASSNQTPGDLDGDGADDVVLAVHDESGEGAAWRIEIAYGTEDRAAMGSGRATLDAEERVEVVGVGDLDRDRRAELVVLAGGDRLLVVPGRSVRIEGNVSLDSFALTLATDARRASVVGDLDGDGGTDLAAILTTDGATHLAVWYGQGGVDLADFHPSGWLYLGDGSVPYDVAGVGDLNADGSGELVLTPVSPNSVGWPRGDDDPDRPPTRILYTGPRSPG